VADGSLPSTGLATAAPTAARFCSRWIQTAFLAAPTSALPRSPPSPLPVPPPLLACCLSCLPPLLVARRRQRPKKTEGPRQKAQAQWASGRQGRGALAGEEGEGRGRGELACVCALCLTCCLRGPPSDANRFKPARAQGHLPLKFQMSARKARRR
jgi:hypothetical protein